MIKLWSQYLPKKDLKLWSIFLSHLQTKFHSSLKEMPLFMLLDSLSPIKMQTFHLENNLRMKNKNLMKNKLKKFKKKLNQQLNPHPHQPKPFHRKNLNKIQSSHNHLSRKPPLLRLPLNLHQSQLQLKKTAKMMKILMMKKEMILKMILKTILRMNKMVMMTI